jgi:hypothetical protein
MKTIEEWHDILTQMTVHTDYGVLTKTKINKPVVAIVPRGADTPQRIAIYPKKTKNAGLVIEKDIFFIPKVKNILGEGRVPNNSNRPHYYDIPDHIIIEVCKTFLFKG